MMLRKINDYLNEPDSKIIYFNGKVNIVNFLKINDFSSKEVSVYTKDNLILIKGNNLVISKMLDDEILIKGDILNIELRSRGWEILFFVR